MKYDKKQDRGGDCHKSPGDGVVGGIKVHMTKVKSLDSHGGQTASQGRGNGPQANGKRA